MKTLGLNHIITIFVSVLINFSLITGTTYSDVTISEIMYGSEPDHTPLQWIEISNTGTTPVNMTAWKLTLQNVNSVDLIGPENGTIVFEDEFWGEAPRLWPNDTLLIVVDEDDNNSGGFTDDQIFALRWRGGLDISFWDTFLSAEGFSIQLIDKDDNVVDQAGNYDGATTLWNLPYYYNRGRIRSGNRTSLIRVYDNGVVLSIGMAEMKSVKRSRQVFISIRSKLAISLRRVKC